MDADVIIQTLAGRRSAVELLARLTPSGSAVSLITIGEVYERAFDSVTPPAHLVIFRALLHPFEQVGLNEPIVERFAEVRSWLRHRGQLISDFDILVAATALHYDFTVLTYNLRHFQRIPELRVFHL
ncbi:MAG TPA: type II toxin-antitoxin system VapC family toxin [Thermomicrobiaceae bacterium]|nr:type II toxin-antitoxin system VapC family toxin [Thermomicrobiaceae bacterium]